MAEERRCQAPHLCANNCGFFGSPAMQDLCSKCYGDLQLKERQSSSAVVALNKSLNSSSASLPSPLPLPASLPSPAPAETASVAPSHPMVDQPAVVEEKGVPAVTRQPNRCTCCNKRVGLTGFKCRCGMTFCGSHRYPEQHACEFDFKIMGREQIAKANPLVIAKKLEKI